MCKIIPELDGNVSDHLPLCMLFTLDGNISIKAAKIAQDEFLARPLWGDTERKNKYRDILERKLENVTLVEIDKQADLITKQKLLDSHDKNISNAMHQAAKEAGCYPEKRFKPKAFWCPELQKLRDKRKFWWRLWSTCGQPRSGNVFECYENLKRHFRCICRNKVQAVIDKHIRSFTHDFKSNNLKSFWNRICAIRKQNSTSPLEADSLAEYYASIMQDSGNLSPDQQRIADIVNEIYLSNENYYTEKHVTTHEVARLIHSLTKGKSPGSDNISTEHLIYGQSQLISSVFQTFILKILSHGLVPESFTLGVIIPVLKKPALNPNISGNYRPITLSTTHAKFIELLMLPKDDNCSSQFGFRDNRGTTFAAALSNDVTSYFRHRGSPVYTCSLEAE